MSKDSHENEIATEVQSFLEQHPDYELFHKFGSPQNFLSRQYQTGAEVIAGMVSHYSHSQRVFANYSMKCLIDLFRYFRHFYSKDDDSLMEDLHKHIAEQRILIYLNTPTNSSEAELRKMACFNVFGPEKYQAMFGDPNFPEAGSVDQKTLSEREKTLSRMSYHISQEMGETSTIISYNDKYQKYHKFIGETRANLNIKHLSPFIASKHDYNFDDHYDINLGRLSIKDDRLFHYMGTYRLKDEKYGQSLTQEKVEYVDKITNLLAKKALETENEEEALKSALVYGVMRGYNLRSIIGACFAQEMSMRWIFANRNWPQFQKMPGVYLDIEAAVLLSDSVEENKKTFVEKINKQVSNYKAANEAVTDDNVLLGDDPIFAPPQQIQKNDFIIYLMETKSYLREDLLELISCEISQEVFNIAAKNGDSSFFKMLREECEESSIFKEKFEAQLTQINQKQVMENAREYGGEITFWVSNLVEPASSVSIKDHAKMAPTKEEKEIS